MSKIALESHSTDLISPTFPYTHTHTHRRHFHLENGSLHRQAGARLTPCILGLQRSLWEDVNSAPTLLQKRVARDLLDPWSTGSVGEAEVKPCGAEAGTSPRTEAGRPEHRRQSSPPGLLGWRWGRGETPAVQLSALTVPWFPSGGSSEMAFIVLKYTQHKIYHFNHFKCPVQNC